MVDLRRSPGAIRQLIPTVGANSRLFNPRQILIAIFRVMTKASVAEFLNDCTFVVRTYVDAQNAFGATIRTHFLVKLQRDIDNPDAWRLIDLFTLD